MVEKILQRHTLGISGYSITDIAELDDLCKDFYSCMCNKSSELCAGGNYRKCSEHNDRRRLEKKFGEFEKGEY